MDLAPAEPQAQLSGGGPTPTSPAEVRRRTVATEELALRNGCMQLPG